ncbi:TM2 domain-containing protein [Deinococcus indicus]|nr:TM2 domain-containing protein [Deinococcus indicus]GHG31750.1 hypothetical protein GCM10017784_26440 [Deinococcus indicus]
MTTEQTAVAQQMFMSQKKDKTTYLILALLLGGLGVHQFYVGNTTAGVLYLLFCWTFIPAILALIDAIAHQKKVESANMEIAQRLSVTMGVPAHEMMKLAMVSS